jgi:hypothetical protein
MYSFPANVSASLPRLAPTFRVCIDGALTVDHWLIQRASSVRSGHELRADQRGDHQQFRHGNPRRDG